MEVKQALENHLISIIDTPNDIHTVLQGLFLESGINQRHK